MPNSIVIIRAFIQKLMEINTEIQRQTLGGAWRIFLKKRRKDYKRQRGQGHHNNAYPIKKPRLIEAH